MKKHFMSERTEARTMAGFGSNLVTSGLRGSSGLIGGDHLVDPGGQRVLDTLAAQLRGLGDGLDVLERDGVERPGSDLLIAGSEEGAGRGLHSGVIASASRGALDG